MVTALLSLFVALGAIIYAKGLFTIVAVAGAAGLARLNVCHLMIRFLHAEDLGLRMAVCTL